VFSVQFSVSSGTGGRKVGRGVLDAPGTRL
jgi:hypothetical protein